MPAPDPRNPDLAKLQSELKDLRKFKHSVESRGAATSKVKIFLAKLWAGPELSKSLEAWINVKETGDSAQMVTATSNLIAAIFRRIFRVGFIFILFAIIPMLLIGLQIIVMERQNQSLIRQIQAERTASSNQQVTEYLRLLLSDSEKQVAAAEGFLASDIVNRDLAVERLAALIKSGNTKVQCSSLGAMSRILQASPDFTLSDALAPEENSAAVVRDLRCTNTDFSGVDFGSITFIDSGFPHSIFKSANLSKVEFQKSNLRHADLSEAFLCNAANHCVDFLEDTDLSYSNLTFSGRSQSIFENGMILTGAQMKFDVDRIAPVETKKGLSGPKQISAATANPEKFPPKTLVSRGVCYESAFSQCYLYHKAKDLGQLSEAKLSTLRQNSCPVNLDGPIVLSSITSCENLGLYPRW
jgi:uncharacterized protein YjbI with pentapeptide repeats